MTYQVLARKWRPQSFGTVVGQEAVTRTLQNALISGRIAHAYCFAGPRGVGKTTTARLLAKALLCGERTGPEPCGRCPACQEVQAGVAVDVIEIDGASNRGIDEIRTLRENVRYAPARGRYKVYIIDEVHMLTEPAFNALLKTLEEPPGHVVFVLATTEPQRVPLTILSRCQRFNFKPIPPELLLASLREILQAEQVAFDSQALPLLARAAEGSLRDALSLLDAALAYGGGRLERAAVAHLLGVGSLVQLGAFVDALLAANAAAALEVIDQAVREGQELVWFTREVVETVRQILVAKVAPEGSSGDAGELRGRAERVSVDELLFILRVFLETEAEMRRSPHPRVELEGGAVRAVRRPVPTTLEALLERVGEAESRLRQMAFLGGPVARSSGVQGNLLEPAPQAPRADAASPARPPVAGRDLPAPPPDEPELTIEAGWRRVVEEVTQTKPVLGAALDQSRPLSVEDGELRVSVGGNHFHAELLAERANGEIVTQAVRRHIPGVTRVEVSVSPTEAEGVEQDPAVRAALEVFQGEVVTVRRRSQEGGEKR